MTFKILLGLVSFGLAVAAVTQAFNHTFESAFDYMLFAFVVRTLQGMVKV